MNARSRAPELNTKRRVVVRSTPPASLTNPTISAGDLGGSLECLEAEIKAFFVRGIFFPSGCNYAATGHALEAVFEKRAVMHLKQTFREVDNAISINADEVGIEGRVVDFGEREAVGHDGLAQFLVWIGYDMRRVEQARLWQAGDCASALVGVDDGFAKLRLMKTLFDQPHGIAPVLAVCRESRLVGGAQCWREDDPDVQA